MDLDQLRTFVAVAEEGRLSAAAERLHLSQPAISARIKALEETLALPLFSRLPKGMPLTEAGRRLLPRAREVLAAAEVVTREAGLIAGELRGSLRIGINSDPALLRLPPVMAALAARHPGLALSLVQGMSWAIAEQTATGQLDAGFVFTPPDAPPARGDLDILLLGRIPFAVVGPRALSERLLNADWNGLADMPWVWFPRECAFHALLTAEFGARGLTPRQVACADGEPLLKALCSSGAGLTLLPESEARAGERDGSLVLWPRHRFTLGLSLAAARNRLSEPGLAAFAECLRENWMSEV